MKRTMIVFALVAAMLLGVVAWANGVDAVVQVTAAVPKTFSVTVDDTAVALGSVAPGTTFTGADTPIVTVKSNEPWTYSESVVYSDATFGGFLADVRTDSRALGDRGVTKMTHEYTLDLTSDAAWELPSGAYTADYTYTALQP